MKHAHIAVWSLALVIAAGAKADLPSSRPGTKEVRAAVRRALPYLARQTDAWIENHKCTSCHQVPHALWAMNRARAAGFKVDDRLAEWNRWSLDFVLSKSEKEPVHDEIYQMLLAGADLPASTRQVLVTRLMASRNESGYWEAQGQLPYQRRPQDETDEATSLWILHALRHEADNPDGADVARRGVERLPRHDGVSIERLALRLLAAREGGEAARAARLTDELLGLQHDDGGWGWLREAPSDAIATGQALYALSFLASDRPRSAALRARDYLIHTQASDGSWKTPSTLARHDGASSVISDDWGTAWAVIGLTQRADRAAANRHVADR